MKARKVSVLFAGLCLAFSYAHAGEMPFPQCPRTLNVQQDVKSSVTDGWKITNGFPQTPLAHISVSSGEYRLNRRDSMCHLGKRNCIVVTLSFIMTALSRTRGESTTIGPYVVTLAPRLS
jgi:hypothetical protein